MKRLLSGLVGLAIAAGGGTAAWLALITDSPTRVIHQNVVCPTMDHTQAKGLQVIGTHRWAQGVVVLYSALCPTKDAKAPMQRVLGHQVVKRDGMNWQVSSSDSYGTGDQKTPSERLIDYGVGYSTVERDGLRRGSSDRYTILYGQILTPKVTAIEATFNTGQVLRDNSGSGTFALVAVGATRVCELRIFGADNQILRQQELTRSSGWQIPRRLLGNRQQRSQCLPVSNQ